METAARVQRIPPAQPVIKRHGLLEQSQNQFRDDFMPLAIGVVSLRKVLVNVNAIGHAMLKLSVRVHHWQPEILAQSTDGLGYFPYTRAPASPPDSK